MAELDVDEIVIDGGQRVTGAATGAAGNWTPDPIAAIVQAEVPMTTLRIQGAEPGILKVHHTRYLRDVVGMRLRDAKAITDDVLDGIPREILVPDEYAAIHEKTLRLLGVRVEIVGPVEQLAASAP